MAPINESAPNPLASSAEGAILVVKPHVVRMGLDYEIRAFLERNGFFVLNHRKFMVTESIARLMYDSVGFTAPPDREVFSLVGLASVIEVVKENAGKELFSITGPADGSKLGTFRRMYGIDGTYNAVFCTKTQKQHNSLLEVISTWETVFAHAMRDYTGDVLVAAEKAAKTVLEGISEGETGNAESIVDGADDSIGVDLGGAGDGRPSSGDGLEAGDDQLDD